MELKTDSLRVVHWNDFGIASDDLHLTSDKVSWGDAEYTLVSKAEMLSALQKEGYDEAFEALSAIEGDVYVALPG